MVWTALGQQLTCNREFVCGLKQGRSPTATDLRPTHGASPTRPGPAYSWRASLWMCKFKKKRTLKIATSIYIRNEGLVNPVSPQGGHFANKDSGASGDEPHRLWTRGSQVFQPAAPLRVESGIRGNFLQGSHGDMSFCRNAMETGASAWAGLVNLRRPLSLGAAHFSFSFKPPSASRVQALGCRDFLFQRLEKPGCIYGNSGFQWRVQSCKKHLPRHTPHSPAGLPVHSGRRPLA